MKNARLALLAFPLFFLIFCSKKTAETPVPPKMKLVWSDEFNYSGKPDTSKWAYDIGGHGWGNQELQ